MAKTDLEEKEKKPKRLSAREVWGTVIRRSLDMNFSKEGPRRDYSFYASTNALYSGPDRVLFMYTIDSLPNVIDTEFKKVIRSKCKEDVRVSFTDYYEKTSIDWNSARMKSRLSTWNKQINDADNKSGGNNFAEITDLDQMNLANRRKLSVSYFNSAENSRGRTIYTKRSLMYIAGYRGDAFDESVADILKYCKDIRLNVNRVTTNIESYLKSFSPFSAQLMPDAKKRMGAITLTDEMAGMFFDYDHGKVGQGTFYMGTDIKSGRSILKYFKESAVAAENILVTAKTGDGKSALIKALYIQFAAADEYRITVMDVEGEEYTPLANYFSHTQSVRRINMASGSGSYYDPVEIPVDSAFKFSDGSGVSVDLYAISVDCTKSIFRTLLGIQSAEASEANNGILSDKEKILNDFVEYAILTTYRQRGVVAGDRQTWKRSVNMSVFDVYHEFEILDKKREDPPMESDTRMLKLLKSDKNFQSQFNILISTLSKYFEEDGLKSGKFKHRVSLREVIDAKHVICSFGLEGKATNTIDKTELALAQISAAHICHLRSLSCKASSKYHVKIFEELNRWGAIPGSYDTINQSITGGRKTGDVTILTTNKMYEVLDNDVLGVLANLTSYFVGSLSDTETIQKLVKRFKIEEMAGELERIMKSSSSASDANNSSSLASRHDEAKKAKDLAEHKGSGVSLTDPYNKSFLIGLDGKPPTVGRMKLPPEIIESNLLRTGNDGKKGD